MDEERTAGVIESRVIRVEALSPKVRRLWLALARPLSFRAGQHVALRREAQSGPDSYYSFAAAQAAPDVFELAVGSGPSTLGELQLGDVVFASAALGRAMLDVFPGNGPLQLVAMGTGVTPLRAVIQEQVARQEKGELPARSLGLLHGCRDESEQLFADEFAGLRARGLLDYRPVLSRPEPGWPGLRGRVQEHVDAFSPTGASYLVCGSIGMVEDVVARLVSGGVSATSILAEGY